MSDSDDAGPFGVKGLQNADPQAQFTDTLAQMSLLLTSLTTKVTKKDVPEPAKFQWRSGTTLEAFFVEFEAYAIEKYGSNPASWLNRLSEYMLPPVLPVCQTLVKAGTAYDVVKSTLLEAYGAKVDPKKPVDYIREFQACKYDPEEGIRGLVSRLRVLANKAYVGLENDALEELVKQQCLAVLPHDLKYALSYQNLAKPDLSLSEMIRIGSGLKDNSLLTREVSLAALESQSSVTLAPSVQPQANDTSVRQRPIRRPSCNCARNGRSPDTCDHALKRCFRCHQVGHFIAQCPQPRNQSVTTLGQQTQRHTPPPQEVSTPAVPSPLEQSSLPRPSAPAQPMPQVCPFCGLPGHYMAACTQFSEYMQSMIRLHKLN